MLLSKKKKRYWHWGFIFPIHKRKEHSCWFSHSSSYSSSLYDKQNATTIESSKDGPAHFPVYYNDVYEVKLPKNHRFPMEKYRMVRELVQKRVHEASLDNDDDKHYISCDFNISPLATIQELTTTHCPQYVSRFLQGQQSPSEIRNVGFPWSTSGVRRALSSVGGTLAAARSVCDFVRRQKQQQEKQYCCCCWSAHIAGGTHHAFRDYGEGFCVFSDIAVASNVILDEYPDVFSSSKKKILILDLDVHQGNGNAVLFQDEPRVMTVSMHCIDNYFSEKQISDIDIELPSGCTDELYLSKLRYLLRMLHMQEKDKIGLVFFQAGVDVIEEDRLGRMSLSRDGLRKRNELVFDFVRMLDGVPLVVTMGGGYPKEQVDWDCIVGAHADVYFGAYQFLREA